MKKQAAICIAAAAALILSSGCASFNSSKVTDTVDKALAQYYTQDLNENLFKASGLSGFSMTGTNMTIEFNTFRQPIQALPQNPSTLDTLMREGFSAARFIGGMYVGGKVLEKAVDSPKVVEQPAPVIVEPKVIQSAPYSPGAFN